MLKRAASLIITMLLLCNMAIAASAHDIPDMEASGSITVHLKSGEQLLESGVLNFYRVGEIVQENGNYGFRLTGDFVASGESLTEVQTPETADRLFDYAKKQQISGTAVPIKNGTAMLTVPQGQLGLYLVAQEQPSAGWKTMKPFLISVPNQENGRYVYQVDATPKVGELSPDEETPPPEIKPVDPTLPQTGQLNWPIPVLTVLGLGLFAVGWALRFRGKKNDHET